jgi:hypothetical protein
MKKTNNKKASAKSSKLENLKQVNGKEEAIKRAKHLEDLIGIKQINPFGTSIAEVFEENISKMSMVELQELAVRAGVFPSGTRTALKSKLSKAFSEYNRSSMVIPSPREIQVDRNNKKTQEALRLMKEGL